MKYVKTLGLAAVAATALMAILGVGSASATTLTGEGGGILGKGSTIHATLESGVNSKFVMALNTVKCSESTFAAVTTTETGGEVFAETSKTSLSFGECGCEVKTLSGGSLSFRDLTNKNGEMTLSGVEITTSCLQSGEVRHCILAMTSTKIGTLTGSENTKTTATMDIASESIGLLMTNPKCENAKWEAKYLVDTPDVLNVIK